MFIHPFSLRRDRAKREGRRAQKLQAVFVWASAKVGRKSVSWTQGGRHVRELEPASIQECSRRSEMNRPAEEIVESDSLCIHVIL